MRRLRLLGAVALVAALALSGCTEDPLAGQYRSGSNKGYISGDGTVTEIAVADRADPIAFSGTDENGSTIDSAELAGRVVVVNFWYASCAPCRAEAADLEKVNGEFAGKDVSFVGVNVRDQAPTAAAFATTFGLSYPSIIDTDSSVQLAFTGTVPPNAVPTTIVLDKKGRVASRILGQLQEASILSTLVSDTLAEQE
ncbi:MULTISPECIES: TlpA family protein disulfide reductase [unclassified Rathayibacter]|uniref:TlpA family protein disulfide reductase n=1 Tax=unclassified Rathayibacter TaxID=2609250 RepID=UPI00188D5F66|nr:MULTISPECIES: TlpA disulfide reductase family protein [unclassified Rathayibacter]MBF4463298.1 TlpA family protein disulfide reductase [Rathayibacter sp. VKM Ac-2879]MBF4504465.1 TlpA family protein disulfide reductase [Rathayibacter sp. VKM Ac-2878]